MRNGTHPMNRRSRLRAVLSPRRARSLREDGAAVVEAAMVTPLFLLIIFGIMELGPTFFEWSSGKNAVHDGVRLSSAVASSSTADYETVRSMRNSLKNLGDKLDYIIVYKAKNFRDPVPAQCVAQAEAHQNDAGTDPVGFFSADAGSTVENYAWGSIRPASAPAMVACNVYYRRMFTLPVSDWVYDRDNALANPPILSLDRFWPGSVRVDYQSGPQDYVGIFVQSRHASATGVIRDRDLRNSAVIRIEPSRATK